MKKTFLSILILILTSNALYSQKGIMHIAGKSCPIDTLTHYMAGPGVWYTQYSVQLTNTRTVYLYMLACDLNNPYLRIEQRNAKGYIGAYEYMSEAHTALDLPSHRAIGGVNCNFYWQASSTTEGLVGHPTGGTAHESVLVTNPDDWNYGPEGEHFHGWDDKGYVIIDRNNRAIMDNFQWDGVIKIADASYSLRDCNRWRTNVSENEIALFNHMQGSNTFASRACEYEVVFSCSPWRINQDLTCTVLSINTTGGTVLKEGQGCLQCRGTGKEFVKNLKVGDNFVLNLGIYSTNQADLRPDIVEMAMGNALCMVDSVLTPRNTNDFYNRQVYARTGMATNKDGSKLWMLVMQTSGMSTSEMCDVFKHVGATHAVGCDGGGSAQLCLHGEVQNKTTNGSPRQANNSVWSISIAPEDSVVSLLHFYDKRPIQLPSYAQFSPRIQAYNQYGHLLNNHFQGYQLSCEPASLGSISEDGTTFIAAAAGGSGKLIVSCGNARAEQSISIIPSRIAIRLDSVYVDYTGYDIEVNALTDEMTYPMQNGALDWTVMDSAIVTVKNGHITPIQNGRTLLVGSIDQYSDTLYVHAEIADAPSIPLSEKRDELTLPIDTTFECKSLRNANVQLSINQTLYGCPDSIMVFFNTTAGVASEMLYLRANNDTKATSYNIAKTVESNANGVLVYPIASIVNTEDQAIYPLTLESIKFTLKDIKKDTPYTIQVQDIILYYSHWKEVDGWLKTHHSETPNALKIMVNGMLYIVHQGEVYDMHGNHVNISLDNNN